VLYPITISSSGSDFFSQCDIQCTTFLQCFLFLVSPQKKRQWPTLGQRNFILSIKIAYGAVLLFPSGTTVAPMIGHSGCETSVIVPLMSTFCAIRLTEPSSMTKRRIVIRTFIRIDSFISNGFNWFEIRYKILRLSRLEIEINHTELLNFMLNFNLTKIIKQLKNLLWYNIFHF